jgi:CheY-like chemotaxis protein
MTNVLVVEDTDTDARQLMALLKDAGVQDVRVASGTFLAIQALELIIEGSAPKPDLLIVDLALGMDSGYEVIRFWKSKPQLADIPLIVWTSMGSKVDEEICRHFHVNSFVRKQQGSLAMQLALDPILNAHP